MARGIGGAGLVTACHTFSSAKLSCATPSDTPARCEEAPLHATCKAIVSDHSCNMFRAAAAFAVRWQRGYATLPSKMGFIGIGNMGGPMAVNLLRAGVQLLVYDRNPAALERLQQLGATTVEHPAALASTPGVSAVITMLPSTEHVQDAYEGPQGLLSAPGGLQPRLLVDCSTILPTYTQHLAARLGAATLAPLGGDNQQQHSSSSSSSSPRGGGGGQEREGGGVAPLFVDAPVSGGVAGATAATLTFMCGGSPEAVAAARPLLSLLGATITHVGPAGSGQVAKICNNLVMAVTMAGLAEGLALGAAAGLEPAALAGLINSASGRCWASEVYNPVPGVCPSAPSSRGYTPGFSAALMAKDLRLALQLAAAAGASRGPGGAGGQGEVAAPAPALGVTGLPMGERAAQLYQQLMEVRPEPLDFSAIYAYVYGGGRGAGPAGQ